MSAGDSSDAESSDDEKINPMNQLMSALGASAEGDDSSSATEKEEEDLSDDNMDSEEADKHDGNVSLRDPTMHYFTMRYFRIPGQPRGQTTPDISSENNCNKFSNNVVLFARLPWAYSISDSV